jgi:hypothetical protein
MPIVKKPHDLGFSNSNIEAYEQTPKNNRNAMAPHTCFACIFGLVSGQSLARSVIVPYAVFRA